MTIRNQMQSYRYTGPIEGIDRTYGFHATVASALAAIERILLSNDSYESPRSVFCPSLVDIFQAVALQKRCMRFRDEVVQSACFGAYGL